MRERRTFIVNAKNERIRLYTASLSTGDALEVDQRYSHDYTKTSQTIIRRRRNTALGGTIRLGATTAELAENNVSIADYIRKFQSLVGKLFTLVWYDREIPKLLCKSVQISPDVDCIETFSGVQISITFVEGFTVRRSAQTLVKAL